MEYYYQFLAAVMIIAVFTFAYYLVFTRPRELSEQAARDRLKRPLQALSLADLVELRHAADAGGKLEDLARAEIRRRVYNMEHAEHNDDEYRLLLEQWGFSFDAHGFCSQSGYDNTHTFFENFKILYPNQKP